MSLNRKKSLIQGFIILLLLFFAFIIWHFLGKHKVKFKKIRKEIPPPLVVIKRFYPKSITITISSYGTVRPVKKISIVPQVSGKVIYLNPLFKKGGIIKKGEVILKIDPSDYKIALDIAKSELEMARNDLIILKEKSKQSINEWRLMHPKGEIPFMVSKEPQLKISLAKVKEAEARLEKARIDLQRTVIKAPFSGIVTEEEVEKGMFVSYGKPVGVLVAIDDAEVYVPLSIKDVRWIKVPGFNVSYKTKGSSALVKFKYAEKCILKKAEVVRSEGIIDEKTRMLRVILKLHDPYKGIPPFLFGSFVEVEIMGKTIKDAFLIPVSAIREFSNIWVVKNNRLYIKKVKVIRYVDNNAIVKGLSAGDEVVISPLPYVKDNMKVRVKRKQ